MVTRSNKICSECKKQVRKFRSYKDKMLCYRCYCKKVRIIRTGGNRHLSLEKALNRTYKINGYLDKDGNIIVQRSFPSILIGHKVKLVLVK